MRQLLPLVPAAPRLLRNRGHPVLVFFIKILDLEFVLDFDIRASDFTSSSTSPETSPDPHTTAGAVAAGSVGRGRYDARDVATANP